MPLAHAVMLGRAACKLGAHNRACRDCGQSHPPGKPCGGFMADPKGNTHWPWDKWRSLAAAAKLPTAKAAWAARTD